MKLKLKSTVHNLRGDYANVGRACRSVVYTDVADGLSDVFTFPENFLWGWLLSDNFEEQLNEEKESVI